MKNQISIIGLFILVSGCNTTQTNSEKENPDSISKTKISILENKSKSSIVYNPSEAIWGSEFDTTGDLMPTKLREFKKDTLTIHNLEKIINTTWPKVQIKYLHIVKDTIYISIPNSEVLTQQMGSSGADEFMMSTTFTLTELQGINHVSFDFVQGDHANPGTYDRSSWSRK